MEWCVPVFVWEVHRLHHRKAFGNAIRSYRRKAGLTQEKLAERAELHHNFIGEVERGNMDRSLTSVVKIARALNVRVGDLVMGI
jgi:transcriptional regulator with XRE-family HTH domain